MSPRRPRRHRKGNPTVAVAYLRVSTEEQHLGPEAQRAAIEEWAARQAIRIASWHLDQGVSGRSELEARPGLGEALAAVRAHRAGLVVVAKRDRLARDDYARATIKRAVEQLGARVVTADGIANGDSAEDRLIARNLDAAADYERDLVSMRTAAALAAKKARGERVGAIPYGYRLARDGIHLEPDPAEQRVIARVRAMQAKGLSLRQIVAACDKARLGSRSGAPFGLTQIARMLRSPGAGAPQRAARKAGQAAKGARPAALATSTPPRTAPPAERRPAAPSTSKPARRPTPVARWPASGAPVKVRRSRSAGDPA
jgi:site-specific DNA recombinase